jgi:hypothetical protein
MKQSRDFSRFIEIITLLGLLLYIAQSWRFANSTDSIGDEGAYLYKGYIFARGDYQPFEEYAFWTNKAPLSYLIPGYIQLWFGPGLREARYFAVFLSVLMLIGIWVTAQRLGGKPWAAVAVWVFALSRATTAIYSEALSQGLVACMMAWMFALTLGEDRPLWQLVLGSALSILIVMTRQNMIVVPALLVLYIFWQFGKKAGVWALSTCAVLFIAFHIYYWPNIMQLWAPWLPRSLTPFLNEFRLSGVGGSAFGMSAASRFRSFAVGIRDNWFIFLGSITALVLFPKLDRWKDRRRFKMAIFLGTSFFLLVIMHTLASIPTDYCVFCFSGYQMFYTTAGLFFLIVVFSNGLDNSMARRVLWFGVVLLFAAILGLSYEARWSNWLLDHIWLLRVKSLFSGGKSLTVSLRDVLTYSFSMVPDLQEQLASALGGLLLGVSFCAVVWILHRLAVQRMWMKRSTVLDILLLAALSIGVMLPVLLIPATTGKCSTNYLSYYERAGRSLSRIIPAGSNIYWKGSGKQLAFLLYVSNANIIPAQINAGGSPAEGDVEDILRLGRINNELDAQWRDSADIYLIWEKRMSLERREYFSQPQYVRVPFDMGGLAQCEDALLVFRRTQ